MSDLCIAGIVIGVLFSGCLLMIFLGLFHSAGIQSKDWEDREISSLFLTKEAKNDKN